MKSNSILFLSIFVFFFQSLVAADIPIKEENSRPGTKSLTFIPLSADYTDPEITLDFVGNIGTVVIYITDSAGNIVDEFIFDTSSTLIYTIPTDSYLSDYYKITIYTINKTYSGCFEVIA